MLIAVEFALGWWLEVTRIVLGGCPAEDSNSDVTKMPVRFGNWGTHIVDIASAVDSAGLPRVCREFL